MTGDVTAPEVTIWVDDDRLETVQSLLDMMGGHVRPIALGSPKSNAASEWARQLDIPMFDDLRQMLVQHPSAFVLLASLNGVSPDDLPMAVAQGSKVIAIDPIGATVAEHAQAYKIVKPADGITVPPGRIVHAPAFDRSAGFLASAAPHDALGEHRAVQMTHAGSAASGSMFFRLFDAWISVLDFIDLPERIDAELSTVKSGSGVPDDPRLLTGRLTAHARLPGVGSAGVLVSDQAAELTRRLTVVGDQAQLVITAGGYELTETAGKVVDHLDCDREPGYLDQLAAQWRRLIDQRTPPPEHRATREQHALACCHACLLSARTGEPESPQRMMDLARV
jgi:predicted dehydrogenase